ncbi:PTS sugar transporter subunit IIB [Spiroplasma sp. DGKH1]|uniref:PTS sugar transporter subunit IIB n=1 Tax=Spiroplasma sp. DGKH1 TaxID=3050074 RepID=UPI0034C61E6E
MNIVLICFAGMSTSMLVRKMQEAADNRGLSAKIWATGATTAIDDLEEEKVDCILIGPQARYALDKMIPIAEEQDCPIDVISSDLYGTFDGEKVLDMALDLIKSY